MGFFNKMINYMTGFSAEVGVEINGANLKDPFPVGVKAKILQDDLNMDKVYMHIRCLEEKLANYSSGGSEPETDNEKILSELNEWDKTTIFKKTVDVAPKGVLKSGETYDWSVLVDLTDASKPSQKSENHIIRWEVWAGIDVPGNDPDSGWVEFDVR